MNRRDFFGLFGALGALPFVGRLAKPSIQPRPIRGLALIWGRSPDVALRALAKFLLTTGAEGCCGM